MAKEGVAVGGKKRKGEKKRRGKQECGDWSAYVYAPVLPVRVEGHCRMTLEGSS